ncbi:ribosome recycling factor domain-containing protein [Podospora australis]|uniref:Ribosome recycling factor domain-containing protein n=1 Tax=Podospora australis TaxID=1536484 RepID=A0AAN6X200_9PEZI|nr:ribosome recycling factor domain-containing protein [Podospora australis]
MKSLRAANSLLRSSSVLRTVAQKSPATASLSVVSQPTLTSSSSPATIRPFSSSTPHLKKKDRRREEPEHDDVTPQDYGGKGSKKGGKKSPTPHSGAPEEAALLEDVFDFSDLTATLNEIDKKFGDDLRKLRSGAASRFNADLIGAIPVELESPTSSPPLHLKNFKGRPPAPAREAYPLRDLATVAPLGGRRWSILAFEESSVKPIISAVQRSPHFNQQPQRNEENPLELIMTVELERADDTAKRAKDLCQNWRNKIRDEVHKMETVFKKLKANGQLLSDDFHKLKERLKKVQDERMKVLTAKEKEAVAAILAKAA